MPSSLIYALIGGGIGALLGYFASCKSGTSPLTASWRRGAFFGALIGLAVYLSSGGGNSTAMNQSSANVTHITQDQFATEVTQSALPVVVDFYATWCGPCRQENPNVVRAFNHYKNQNFTILGVSLDRPGGKDRWLKAIHKDSLAWTQVSDLKFWDSEPAALYAVRGIPQNFLIDPNGKIIAKNLRGEDLEIKLEELFGKI